MGEPAAPDQRLAVRGGRPPQLRDRLVDGLERQRQGAALERRPQQHDVGRQVIAEHRLGQAGRVGQQRALGPDRLAEGRGECDLVDRAVGLQHRGRRDEGGVDHRARPPRHHLAQVRRRRRLQDVARQVEVGVAVGDGGGRDVGARRGDVQVRDHGAGLLRQPRLVDALHRVPGDDRGPGDDAVGGHDAGAADARRVDAEPAGDRPGLRGGQVARRELWPRRLGCPRRRRRSGPPAPAALVGHERDERRAVTFEARVVLVARRLVDLAAFAELGLDGQHRQAVAHPRAVAAALAHGLVDHDAPGRVVELAPLAQAAGLGRAALVVDQHRHARLATELFLHVHDVLAGPHGHAGGEVGGPPVPADVVGAHRDGRDALGRQRARQRRDVHQPGHVLAAGHGDVRVVEQLERDVDAGGDARPDGQAARVAERAVAEVLEQVAVADERRQPDPVRPLGPHRGGRDERLGAVAGLEVDHAVAADAAARDRADRHDRGPVVRAAAAEGGQPAGDLGQREPGPPETRGGRRGEIGDDPGEDGDEAVGGELAGHRHEGRPGAVALAPDGGGQPRLVHDRPHLLLDERALLLDHEDLVDRPGQLEHAGRGHRIGHRQLQDPDARAGEVGRADAARLQRPEHVAVRLARADDAQPGRALGADEPVEPPGGHPPLCGPQAAVEPQLLEVAAEDPAHGLVTPGPAVDLDLGVDGGEPVDAGVDGGDAVGHRGHDAHADPRPAEAAEPERLDAEVEQVLLVGRHQHRGRGVGQRQVGVVGQRRRLGRGVVADEQHRPAARSGAHEVGVLQHVARPVEAGALAVPGADDAVDVLVGDGAAHLRPPDRGGGELLVEAGTVDDPAGVEAVAQAIERQVDAAEGRPRVAGHEGGGVEPVASVEVPAGHQQLAHRFDPRQQPGRRARRPGRIPGVGGAGGHRGPRFVASIK